MNIPIHSISKIFNGGRGETRGGYSHILAIWVCVAGKVMVLKPFSLV